MKKPPTVEQIRKRRAADKRRRRAQAKERTERARQLNLKRQSDALGEWFASLP